MSERKVLNKYYPPDYDPAKIPRLKRAKDRQYVIRVMAPFHMRCKTCGNYIYKGTKFNARQETVQDRDYLGLRIYRFYIKCTKCVAEITFLTDPANQDYAMEHGATRNFEAEKLLDEERKREEEQRLEDESNPMKMLEKRTKDSKREMEMMETLEELREQNEHKASVDIEKIMKKRNAKLVESEEERLAREKREDDKEMEEIKKMRMNLKRLPDITDHDDLTENIKHIKKKFGIKDAADEEALCESKKKDVKLMRTKLGIVVKKKKSSDQASTSDQNPPLPKPDDIEHEKKPAAGLAALADYGSSSDDQSS